MRSAGAATFTGPAGGGSPLGSIAGPLAVPGPTKVASCSLFVSPPINHFHEQDRVLQVSDTIHGKMFNLYYKTKASMSSSKSAIS